MREMILLFHLPDRARRRKVETALLPLKIRLKYVSREEYNQPLGVLAGSRDIKPAEGIYEGGELPDTFFVFSALSGPRLDQVLYALRKCGAGPFPYKAVLTPANQFWTAPRCFAEIKSEHEQMQAVEKNAD